MVGDQKICPRCRQTKPGKDFYPHRGSKDGLHCWCKICQKNASKQYRDTLAKRSVISVNKKTKQCGKCKQIKSVCMFSKNKQVRDGYSHWCKICKRAYALKFNQKPEQRRKTRNRNLQYNYGISLEAYECLFEVQNGRCVICGATKSSCYKSDWLVVDHDRVTGRIRGLLCNRCNRTLGMAEHNVELLQKMQDYLNAH